MKNLTLTNDGAKSFTEDLEKVGYSVNSKQQNISFDKGYGDKTYLSHSLNIVRATKNTEGERVSIKTFGLPNGKASESQDDRYSTWFFNGYNGKSGSKIY
jgi:hypothetical protein